jgi:hypothetical protein
VTVVKSIAGMSLKGGRKDNFYFCLIEHYPDSKRSFLKSLIQVRDEEEGMGGDDVIRGWINKFELKELVVDFPISKTACEKCLIECPGAHHCPVKSVVTVKSRMQDLLAEDAIRVGQNPKKYEQERNLDDEVHFIRDILAKAPTDHMLSRSFRRRLKKGFLPYWNREVDFWIWGFYYDHLLKLFNFSYDSFGNTSTMVLARFSYLKRHFPSHLKLYESFIPIVLIELVRSGVILKKDLMMLQDLELGHNARHDIIKKLEKHLDVFVYDHDLDILCRQPRAFESFMLAIVGHQLHFNRTRKVPEWAQPEEVRFLAPVF